MKTTRLTGSLFLSILLPAVLVGLPAQAQNATVSPATQSRPAVQMSKTLFQFENKQRKVTVKNVMGDTVWGGLIDTKNVRLTVTMKPDEKIRFALADENGKPLWETAENVGAGGSFEFKANQSLKNGAEGVTLGVTSRPASASDTKKTEMTARLVLGDDNVLVEGDFKHDGDERTHLARRGNDMVITHYKGEQKTSEDVVRATLGTSDAKLSVNNQSATVNGTGSIQLKDAGGIVIARSVKQDGKDYVELILGDRRVLIEGKSFSANVVNGVLQLSVQPAAAPGK